ncbi:MAG: hypothetical protein AAGI17_03975 [Planctomycetota bacterium]
MPRPIGIALALLTALLLGACSSTPQALHTELAPFSQAEVGDWCRGVNAVVFRVNYFPTREDAIARVRRDGRFELVSTSWARAQLLGRRPLRDPSLDDMPLVLLDGTVPTSRFQRLLEIATTDIPPVDPAVGIQDGTTITASVFRGGDEFTAGAMLRDHAPWTDAVYGALEGLYLDGAGLSEPVPGEGG